MHCHVGRFHPAAAARAQAEHGRAPADPTTSYNACIINMTRAAIIRSDPLSCRIGFWKLLELTGTGPGRRLVQGKGREEGGRLGTWEEDQRGGEEEDM